MYKIILKDQYISKKEKKKKEDTDKEKRIKRKRNKKHISIQNTQKYQPATVQGCSTTPAERSKCWAVALARSLDDLLKATAKNKTK